MRNTSLIALIVSSFVFGPSSVGFLIGAPTLLDAAGAVGGSPWLALSGLMLFMGSCLVGLVGGWLAYRRGAYRAAFWLALAPVLVLAFAVARGAFLY